VSIDLKRQALSIKKTPCCAHVLCVPVQRLRLTGNTDISYTINCAGVSSFLERVASSNRSKLYFNSINSSYHWGHLSGH